MTSPANPALELVCEIEGHGRASVPLHSATWDELARACEGIVKALAPGRLPLTEWSIHSR
jgi:hypothetical protein